MWLHGFDWDQQLDEELRQEVKEWFSEFTLLKNVRIPRCSCESKEVDGMTIHVFADASSEAYGAVAYARHLYKTGEVSVRFIYSKTKVAPLMSMSIPRLQLMAAILALRLSQNVVRALEIAASDVQFWNDCMNVLWWLRSHSRTYKPFVANRIGELQMAKNPEQWRYVPTDVNPAALASRGIHSIRNDGQLHVVDRT
jgi:Pao retrotransposon peptidase